MRIPHMFDSIELSPTTPRGDSRTKATPRRGFVALFKAALEKLVSAQSPHSADPLQFRFPPF
jgi:hypothetical protein